jgi:hypothetical protein
MKHETYIDIRREVLRIRAECPALSSPQILDKLSREGYRELPVRSTITEWCRAAGMPIQARNKRIYGDDVVRRAVALQKEGHSAAHARWIMTREFDPCPSVPWVRSAYQRRPSRRMSESKATAEVIGLLQAGVIELGEAWDALTDRGMSDEKALAWVMSRFTLDGAVSNAGGDSGKVFSMRELRWAA